MQLNSPRSYRAQGGQGRICWGFLFSSLLFLASLLLHESIHRVQGDPSCNCLLTPGPSARPWHQVCGSKSGEYHLQD